MGGMEVFRGGICGLDGDRPHAQIQGRVSVSWFHGALASCQVKARTCRATVLRISGSSVSDVRAFGGGVAPLTRMPSGSLYNDNQGTQGFPYTPGQNFETYSFRNPTTGQAWGGVVGTLGPQLSIGIIQGANQAGTPLVLPGPPRETSPLAPIQSGILDPGPASILDNIL